jgi:arginine exporter protein ArgO
MILGGSAELDSIGGKFLFVVGAAISSFSWQIFLAGLGAIANRRFSKPFQQILSISGNIIIIVMGIRIAIS